MPHRQPQRAFQVLAHHPEVRALLQAAAGTPCHLVGGVLRDRLLGLASRDVDAVVAGRGREIAERLAEDLPARLVPLGGKEFAAFRLVGKDFVLDLWDRGEASLEADLARRDFTVNSFAYDPLAGTVADPFGGLPDLGRRVLRATTAESFALDPLRVLRLPRLVLQLPGFAAGPNTLGLARRSAPQVALVAAERVREELALIFGHEEAHQGLALLAALDLYPGLWLGRPGEPGPPEAAGRAVRELEALAGCAAWLRGLSPRLADAVDPAAARWAILFANLTSSPGMGFDAARALLERFRDAGYLPRRQAATVARLLDWEAMPAHEPDRRRFIHACGEHWPTAACFLGARSAARGADASWRAALRPLAELALREERALLDPPRLLTGAEVQTLLGIPPGPRIGEVLATVREAQVEGSVRSREEALELVRRLEA